MRSWTAIAILCLAWVLVVPGAAPAEDMDVAAQAMGNDDIVLIRVGLAEPNGVASWGLSIAHKPETATANQSTSFGAFGMLSTDVEVLSPGTLGLWAGLTAKPFLDIDLMYDIDQSKIQVWPGAGVRLAPTKTLALIARAIYPIGDDNSPSAVDLNEMMYLFGLEIVF